MPRKKKETVEIAESVVIRGSHSTRIEHPDGRIEFETHWDELVRDVQAALDSLTEVKPKATRKKKIKEN
jgi:hypothetical protein